MKPLTAVTLNGWLMNSGYLEEIEEANKTRKIPTAKGLAEGIFAEERISQKGAQYTAVLYSRQAQIFILRHVNEITQFSAEQ
jgi:hypothetical protein